MYSVGKLRKPCVVTWVTRTRSRMVTFHRRCLLSLLWSLRRVPLHEFGRRDLSSRDVRSTSRVEMDPSFLMGTLAVSSRPSMPKRKVKAPCMRTCHSFFGTRRFENLHTSDHSPGTPPGPHNGVEPSGIGKFVLTNAPSIMLMGRGSLPDWRRHAVPLKSLAIPRFLAYVLLMWSDTTVKEDSPLRGIQAQEMTACSTHPDCPSHSLIVAKLNDGIISQRHSWWTRVRLCAETLEPTH